MATLEYWVRLVRLPFIVGFAVAGYFGLLQVAKGWEHTFLLWVFWPFILATIILETMLLTNALHRARNKVD